ncbi:Hypothetical predicted protein [Paramuricea clavata]|nr:Hypothetical predicted protein [Paramuricea clavata]
MLASAKTSHSGNVASHTEALKATLDFVLHTDFNPLTMNCSKKQVDLLFQLYSNAVQLTSSVGTDASFNENESLYPARSISATVASQSRTTRRTNSITSSSGFDVVDDESVSSESTPKPSVTSLETPTISPSLVHVSLWVQWTLPKLSFNLFGNDRGSDLRITTEMEDWSASFDYQNGHFKAQCKVGNLSITHYEIGSSGQWTTGPGGGTILARQDSLSSSLSKVHDSKSDDSDPGRHGFLYVEYTASSVIVPSFKAAFEHDDVFQNSFGYSQDVHVTIQPFDFILWCPLLYTITTVFHTFASLQSDSVGKCESQGVPLLDPGVETHKILTNLPEINLKLRGFRVVVPSCIDPRMFTGKQDHSNVVNNSDLFTIQATSLLVSSRLENPISRLVLDKKLSKALTAFARSRRGSAAERGLGDTQYKIEVKGLRIWSGCWEELCRMLPNQDPSRIERDLLEQNPALEWNTHSGQDRSSALVIPVVSDLDIKCIVAPPISLTTSSKSQRWNKPIFGLSFEVNLTTDVECFISKTQVQLMQTILKENITNSGLSNDDVTSDVTTDTPTAFSHPPRVAAPEEKLDSGCGSECSHKNRHVIKSRDSKPDVQEMECLATAGGLSVFVYEHSTTGEAWTQLVPVVRVSLIQPAFNCTRRADSDTIQISCFDISLAKCKSNTRSADNTQLVPSAQDYDVIWFRTGDGSPDKHTELAPAFANFTCKLYPSSPADLKLDFGRPIWIDVDLGLLERLQDFSTDLNMQETKLDNEHQTSSESDVMNIVRSVAISTDYVAITATAGQDMEIDPVVKVSCSSMNLGVSLKADEREDFCQRIAANLHLCAITIATSIDDKLRSFLLPYDASIDLELFCSSPSISQDTYW